jgi:DNA-binding MarR family transcriptional regulator
MDMAVKPQGCTNLKLRQLGRRVAQHYDTEMRRVGLKTTQYSLLSFVCKLGPIRPTDLAKTLGLQPSTLSRNLKPLVAAGWLQMLPGDDGRSLRVAVTQAGRDKRAEAQRHWRNAQEGINAALGARRVVALHALIDECTALLAPADDEGDVDG